MGLKVLLFEATKHVDCSYKRAQHMNPAIDSRKGRFSHSERFFSDFKVILTTPSVYSSEQELATSYVVHNESFTQLIFLSSMKAEEAWLSTSS
jgi:hypothetical protein